MIFVEKIVMYEELFPCFIHTDTTVDSHGTIGINSRSRLNFHFTCVMFYGARISLCAEEL